MSLWPCAVTGTRSKGAGGMGRSVRFLLTFSWPNLGAIFGFAGIVIAGCCATGVPGNTERGNLFESYYAMFPVMILLCLFLYAFALCTNNLNLGLSMGARRRDFFWAIQADIGCCALVCWALQRFLSAFPALAGWEERGRWTLLRMFNSPPWSFPLACAALMVMGCLCGLLMARHRVLGTILVVLSILAAMMLVAFMLLSAESRLMDLLRASRWGWLWRGLPGVLAVLLAVGTAGSELLMWRFIQRYAVR